MAKREREPIKWITVNGRHVPLYEGEPEAIQQFLKSDNTKGVFKSTSQSDVREPNKEAQIAKAKADADRLNGKTSKFDPSKASDEYTDEFIHDKFHTFCEECIYELEDAKGKDPNFAGAKEYINSLLKKSQFDYGDIKEIISKGTVGGKSLFAHVNNKEVDVNPFVFRLTKNGLEFKSDDTNSGWISEEYLDF